jgi:hypothetical protein
MARLDKRMPGSSGKKVTWFQAMAEAEVGDAAAAPVPRLASLERAATPAAPAGASPRVSPRPSGAESARSSLSSPPLGLAARALPIGEGRAHFQRALRRAVAAPPMHRPIAPDRARRGSLIASVHAAARRGSLLVATVFCRISDVAAEPLEGEGGCETC